MITSNQQKTTKTVPIYFGILLILSIISQILCQVERSQNPCVSIIKCNECIQTKSCAWCFDPEFGDKPRCFQPSLQPFISICEEKYTANPDNIKSTYMDRNLTVAEGGWKSISGSSFSNSSGYLSESGRWVNHKITQIKPQRIGLQLRINQEYRLQFDYAQAEDYPVDLYYLMDLSKSMEDDKDKLSKLGDLLSATMKNITSNFRLGFGSFVDKVLMPYVSTVPKKLIHPCDGCEAPYGYRNHMPLSTNTTAFSEEVRNAAVSGNLDAPEGGFDAIMQAIVCREQINWRDQARRLLVFSTDAGFHYAGDGKLGGVITPNDGECHLNADGLYTHSSYLDYPSISQINLKVKQNSINVIFAVTASQHDVYEQLSKIIEGSSSAVLQDDSSNVVDLVRDEYNKISSTVEMKDNSSPAVKVTFYSSCKTGDKPIATSKCANLKVGDLVKFEAEIVVTQCPEDPKDWKQTFQIYPVGINESLTVDLEMLCSCDCEDPKHKFYELNSTSCENHGSYKCGVCECEENYFGRKCECSSSEVHSTDLSSGCREDNTTTIDCSRRGNCICGVCECDKRDDPNEVISGKYCQCDNFSCDRHNDYVCSGPDHGTCNCGVCTCLPGWKGSACECRDSIATCVPPGGGEICSGHGECICGECRCNSTDEGRYSGQFCEKCHSCAGRCTELKDCVTCQMYNTGPLAKENACATNCTLFVPIHVDVVEVNEKEEENRCSFYDEDDCRYVFVYSEKGDQIIVRAQHERDCPAKVFMLGIVLAVIAAIVLMGLAILLLWKLLTTIHDRREFARFEKERMMAKWDTGENPIYKQATSTFKNPTYAGK